jgi:endonuclease I
LSETTWERANAIHYCSRCSEVVRFSLLHYIEGSFMCGKKLQTKQKKTNKKTKQKTQQLLRSNNRRRVEAVGIARWNRIVKVANITLTYG